MTLASLEECGEFDHAGDTLFQFLRDESAGEDVGFGSFQAEDRTDQNGKNDPEALHPVQQKETRHYHRGDPPKLQYPAVEHVEQES